MISKFIINLPINCRGYMGKTILLSCLIIFSFYAKAQTFAWVKQIQYKSQNGADFGCRSVALDSSGNVFVTGIFQDTADFNPGTGSAILTSATGEKGAYLAKYDSYGNPLWQKSIMSSAEVSYGLYVDETGNVYVIGIFIKTSYFKTGSGIDSLINAGATSYPQTFLVKYDNNGNYIWAKSINGIRQGSSISFFDLAIGTLGDVYVTGHFTGTVDFDPGPGIDTLANVVLQPNGIMKNNIFVAKYTPEGNYTWAKVILGNDDASAYAIAIDKKNGQDNIIISGSFKDTVDFDPSNGIANLVCSGNRDIFMSKYDENGSYKWAKRIGGDSAAYGENYDVAVDESGNIYTTGYFGFEAIDFDPGPDKVMLNPVGILDMYLARYDRDGNYIWAKNMGGIGAMTSGGHSLALNKEGYIYVRGGFIGNPIDLDPSPRTAIFTPKGMADGFIAKYDTCGNYIWAGSLEGSGTSINSNNTPGGQLITINSTGNCYVAGDFSGTVDFDPGANETRLSSYYSTDGYLLKLNFDSASDTILSSYVKIMKCSDSFSYNGTTYTTSGTYKQKLPGITRCDSIVVLDLTLSSIQHPVINIEGFTLGVSGIYTTYQWTKNGAPIPGATGSTYTLTANGAYQVVVANKEGCSDTSEIYQVDNYTSIKNMGSLARKISVYPNPANDVLHIQSPVLVNIILTDITGRAIMEVNKAKDLSLKHLNAGIYLLQVKDGEDLLLRNIKVVKQ